MKKGLIDTFKKTGLRLEVLDAPIRKGAGMENIVQIDIQRGRKSNELRNEWFRLFPGKDTTIQVRGTDKKSKQLVLLVKESKQEFQDEIAARQILRKKDWKKRFLDSNPSVNPKDVIGRKGDHIIIKGHTQAETRYFLMGVDERQLFIAQLTGPATSVQGARKLLGNTVQFAEGKRRGSSLDRQGEWFFLETTSEQRETLTRLLREKRIVIQKKQVIGDFMNRGGNPHTADELIHISDQFNELGHKDSKELPFPIRGRKVFVRGRIRHVDHKTIKFNQWREVVANNEGATAAEARGRSRAAGVFWVD